jgi:hypothetical protein
MMTEDGWKPVYRTETDTLKLPPAPERWVPVAGAVGHEHDQYGNRIVEGNRPGPDWLVEGKKATDLRPAQEEKLAARILAQIRGKSEEAAAADLKMLSTKTQEGLLRAARAVLQYQEHRKTLSVVEAEKRLIDAMEEAKTWERNYDLVAARNRVLLAEIDTLKLQLAALRPPTPIGPSFPVAVRENDPRRMGWPQKGTDNAI